MGLTHADFFKTLPAAIEHHPFLVDQNTMCINYDDRHLVIELGREQVRTIALLRMPHVEVTFRFTVLAKSNVCSSCTASICIFVVAAGDGGTTLCAVATSEAFCH